MQVSAWHALDEACAPVIDCNVPRLINAASTISRKSSCLPSDGLSMGSEGRGGLFGLQALDRLEERGSRNGRGGMHDNMYVCIAAVCMIICMCV